MHKIEWQQEQWKEDNISNDMTPGSFSCTFVPKHAKYESLPYEELCAALVTWRYGKVFKTTIV